MITRASKFGNNNIKQKFISIWGNLGLLALLLIIIGIFSMMSSDFRNITNIITTIKFASFVGIGAIGMTFLLMSGEFDISVGSLSALIGLITFSLIPKIGAGLSILLMILLAMSIEFVNGIIVTKLRIPAFITTLAMYFILRALAYIYTNLQVLFTQDETWLSIASNTFLGIPIPIYIIFICYVFGYLLMRRSPYGRYVIAVGSNPDAAKISGINSDMIKISAFVLTGFFVAISTIIITSAQASVNPAQLGVDYEFQVLTAVVLGGTIMGGGEGSLGGTFIASLIIVFFYNGLTLLGIQPYWQSVAIGILLISSVALHNLRLRALGQR